MQLHQRDRADRALIHSSKVWFFIIILDYGVYLGHTDNTDDDVISIGT